jgi:hypothetical protein
MYPLAKGIEEYDIPNKKNVFPISELNPELLQFFQTNNINLEDEFNIFTGNVANIPPGESYTDGNYFLEYHKRFCSMNWNFAALNGVNYEYFSIEGANHSYDAEEDHTIWTNTQFELCPINPSSNAVLVNPQVPTVATHENNEGAILYVKLLFRESWESINLKLEPYIV